MSEQLFLSLVLFNPHCNPVKQEDQFCLGQKIIRKYRERNDMVSNLKALLLDVKWTTTPWWASPLGLSSFHSIHSHWLSFAYRLPNQDLEQILIFWAMDSHVKLPLNGPLDVPQALQTHHVQYWALQPHAPALPAPCSVFPASANAPSSNLSSKLGHWALLSTSSLCPSLQLSYCQVLMMLLLSTLTSSPSLLLRTYNTY